MDQGIYHVEATRAAEANLDAEGRSQPPRTLVERHGIQRSTGYIRLHDSQMRCLRGMGITVAAGNNDDWGGGSGGFDSGD